MQASALADFTYARDKIGRITGITETTNGSSTTETSGYDETGRLTSMIRNGVMTTWQYEANGDRTHENGSVVATYDDQDRLLSYGTAGYSYTANGELQSKTENGVTTTYNYDEFSNLISVTMPGDIKIEYVIDGQNRRIGKKVNGSLIQGFLYADQLNPVAELDANGAIAARFIYVDLHHFHGHFEYNS